MARSRGVLVTHRPEFPSSVLTIMVSMPLMTAHVKVFGCRPMTNGAANSALVAGVRKPPREEIAGRDGWAARALWRFDRHGWGAGWARLGSGAMMDCAGAAEPMASAVLGDAGRRRSRLDLGPEPGVRARVTVAGRRPVKRTSRFAAPELGRGRHDVSILMARVGATGRYRGWVPRAKVSMMIMRPPQQGQGCAGVGGSSIVSTSAGLL